MFFTRKKDEALEEIAILREREEHSRAQVIALKEIIRRVIDKKISLEDLSKLVGHHYN
jgi:hypothetical protein